MTQAQAAQAIAGFLADRKATDIVILDVSELSSVTDAFVIATGRSGVHVKAACRHVEDAMRDLGQRPISCEGLDHGHWALLDYGDVVVHVFQKASRNLYDLERLWGRAPRTRVDESAVVTGTRN